MSIYFKNPVIKAEVEKRPQVTTMDEIRNRPRREPPKPPQQAQQEPQEIINKDTIRPSHIEDENILYKSSGYLKDLIGEGK